MKIYTKTGDQGETSLLGGVRVSKADLQIQVIGEVDELNSALGVAIAQSKFGKLLMIGEYLQNWLFEVGSLVAEKKNESDYTNADAKLSDMITRMEGWIDELTKELPALQNFILPGGSVASADWHLARAVCRRVERTVVAAAKILNDGSRIKAFFNRLADLLFTMARAENAHQRVPEVIWKKM